MARKELTIEVAGRDEHVTVDLLIETLKNTLAILQNLARPRYGERAVQWEIIRASMRSPLSLTLAPKNGIAEQDDSGNRAVGAYFQSMRAIERRTAPPQLDEEGLQAARRLAEMSRERESRVTFSSPDEGRISPSSDFAESVKEIISQETRYHEEVGTLEGRLQMLSTYHGDRFAIWEPLSNNRVVCSCTPQQLEEAKDWLRRRVAVSGTIRYNRRGEPTSIRAKSIKPLREIGELPQPDTMEAVDITGGLSPEEYVRRLRDA